MGLCKGNAIRMKRYSGSVVIVVALVLPFLARWWGNAFVARAMKTDPVPQDAMVIAFLGLIGSIILAIILLVTGIVQTLRHRPNFVK